MTSSIVVLAGVNDAGKSSVAGAAIESAGAEFYNPDAEARELRRTNQSLSIEQANAQAWELGRGGLERALATGGFFAFETTLGANTIPDMLITHGERGSLVQCRHL